MPKRGDESITLQAQPAQAAAPPRLAIPVHAGDHVRGPSDAPVTLVEYADFECPDSAHATSVLREAQHQVGRGVRLVFRHFPLRQQHPHAQWAAEAAEAADAQGRFWEMHDQLYVHQHLLGDEHLDLYATWIGLDLARLRRDLDARHYAARVEEDRTGGERSGVIGTPTFFIEGVFYAGPYEPGPLAAALDAAARR
jgi:protein-disulfide isomerase